VCKCLTGLWLYYISGLPRHSSVKISEAHYANWIGFRKARLKRLVAESLVNA
jgi:hypothetical protein